MSLPDLPNDRFEHRLEWARLVTAANLREMPIYNWYVYPHSYSREIVHYLLDELGVTEGVVYDPFVGAGTTILACKERGLSAYGLDLLPLSVFITNAKVAQYDVTRLRPALSAFSFQVSPGQVDHFADIPVVEKSFSPAMRLRVSCLYDEITHIENGAVAMFYRLCLLAVLDDLGALTKDGGWPRIDPLKKVHYTAVKKHFIAKARQMLADLESAQMVEDSQGTWQAILGDARTDGPPRSVVAAISSPPYLNRHDYTRVFAAELGLGFIENQEALKCLRYKTLRSHPEARPPDSARLDSYNPPAQLQDIIEQIRQKEPDRRIIPMIKGYFEDMYLVLRNLKSHVEPGGKIAFVLGNSRFYGVLIPVDEIIGQIGEDVGFQLQKILITRYRGNSAQQMGKYGRQPARESIVIWQRP